MPILSRRHCLNWMLATGAAAVSLRVGAATAMPREDARPPVGEPWPPTNESFVASTDGTAIFHRSGGDGDATVLFVHGWSCHSGFFGPQFAALAPGYRFCAMDLAGHGRSGHRAQHSMEAFVADVQAVADTLPGPLVLVVHSAGGRVACAAAPALGDRLLGIVGIDTLQNLGLPAPPQAQVEQGLAGMQADFGGNIERMVGAFFPPGSDPDLVAWVRRQMSATSPRQAIGAMRAYMAFDAASAIDGFDKPVVAINNDGVPTHADVIRRLMPRFEARIQPGWGHFLHLGHADDFNPLLLLAVDAIAAA